MLPARRAHPRVAARGARRAEPQRRDAPGLRRHADPREAGGAHRPRARGPPEGDRRRAPRAGRRAGRLAAALPPRADRVRPRRPGVPGRPGDALPAARRAVPRPAVRQARGGVHGRTGPVQPHRPGVGAGGRGAVRGLPLLGHAEERDDRHRLRPPGDGPPGHAPRRATPTTPTGACCRRSGPRRGTCREARGRLHRRVRLRRVDLGLPAGRAVPRRRRGAEHPGARARPAAPAHRLQAVDGHRAPGAPVRAGAGAGRPDRPRRRRRRQLEPVPGRVAALAQRDLRAPRPPPRRRAGPAHVADARSTAPRSTPTTRGPRPPCASSGPRGTRSRRPAACGRRRSTPPGTPATAFRRRSTSTAASRRAGATRAASSAPRTP